MELLLWIAIFYFGEFVSDDQGKWNWKRDDTHVVDGLEIVNEISYKELYGKLLDLCNVDSSLHELEMRFLLPGDVIFAESIQITLDKHAGEFLKRHKCSRCGATGHNRLRCTHQIPISDNRAEK
ncbi:hypothetical protein Fot_42264 [Forsythia ovata]|uniref:CCHC-type domain-containing protein n=1 Tax=Forsythia ovata TaxID=205694 RepID=A0ABD1RKR4_9LAMI